MIDDARNHERKDSMEFIYLLPQVYSYEVALL
jgi:hypothetical protein